MKTFRSIFLTITLSCFIMMLVLNLASKSILKEVKEEFIKTMIPDNIISEESSNWLKEHASSDKIKNFFNQYIDEDLVDKVKDKMKKSTESMKKEIENITEEFIKEQEEKLSPKQKLCLNIYRFITNAKLKGILIIAIFINIILLCLTQKSIWKWIRFAGYACIISGDLLILLVEWVKNYFTTTFQIETITLYSVFQPAFFLLIGGIAGCFIYLIISKIVKMNQKEKDDEE